MSIIITVNKRQASTILTTI